MKLTEEQSQKVADNHNLIYWYINYASLDFEEWYDLLAIELCYTVQKWEESRGSLGNYFKLRADGLVYKERRKAMAKKRLVNKVEYIDEIDYDLPSVHMEDNLDFEEWLNGEFGQIIKMKYEGYSQTEIALHLGVSQSHVSKTLKKIRRDFHEVN